MLSAAASASAPMSGEWDCTVVGDVATAVIRLQTGEKTIRLSKPDEFRYGDFSFAFEGDSIAVRLRVNDERKAQKVPYFRQGNYITFNYNLGLDETGWASPITFWTNETGSQKARYEVSFPSASMRVIKTMSGAEVHSGDAALAVAALSCTKRASQ
jgi:hypothetical protein